MPQITTALDRRLRGIERELQAIREDIESQSRFDDDALYILAQGRFSYLVRGSDITATNGDKIVRASRFVYLNDNPVTNRKAGEVAHKPGTFIPHMQKVTQVTI